MQVTSFKMTVYGPAQAQGSMRAFIPKGWKRPILTSTNPKLKSWRQEVTKAALRVANDSGMPMIAKGIGVSLSADFYFAKPKSKAKRVTQNTVRPDLSKLVRALEDGLTGVVYQDDSQIVEYKRIRKFYGLPERTEVQVEIKLPEIGG